MSLSNLFAPLKPKDILKYSAYSLVSQLYFFVFTYLIASLFKYQFPSSDPFSFFDFAIFASFNGNIFHLCSLIVPCFLFGVFYSLRTHHLSIKQAPLRLVSFLFILSSTCIALNFLGARYYTNPSAAFYQIQQRQEKHFITMHKEYAALSTPFRKTMFWTSIVIVILGILPSMIIPIAPWFILFYSGYILLKVFFRKLLHTV